MKAAVKVSAVDYQGCNSTSRSSDKIKPNTGFTAQDQSQNIFGEKLRIILLISHKIWHHKLCKEHMQHTIIQMFLYVGFYARQIILPLPQGFYRQKTSWISIWNHKLCIKESLVQFGFDQSKHFKFWTRDNQMQHRLIKKFDL